MSPMRAAAARWQELTGSTVEWVVRSGDAFATQAMDEATRDVDLLSFDHPFVGQAVQSGALLPLDQLLPDTVMRELAADAVGLSHESYAWDGHQWGLAADAACQVSVVRADLLGDRPVPATWDDALSLACSAHGRVTTSLNPHDAICTLLTWCAGHGSPLDLEDDGFLGVAAVVAALDWLSEFVKHCHASAWDGFVVGPMAMTDEIAYGLLQWGYTNYSRRGFPGHRLRFTDIPSAGAGPIGATLGGAGLGVSATSRHPGEAAAFAAWVCSPDMQRELVYPAGGQPGSRTAWLDRRVDGDSGGFFSATLATMSSALLRPRAAWWPPFQHHGGNALVAGLRNRRSPRDIASDLDAVYRAARGQFCSNQPKKEEHRD